MQYRVAGAFLFLCGVALAYGCVLTPIEEATAHAKSISFYWKCAILCPIALTEGIIFLILGDEVRKLKDDHGKPTRLGLLMTAVLVVGVVAGLLLASWMESSFAKLGYNEELF